jgi:hypothetical protein
MAIRNHSKKRIDWRGLFNALDCCHMCAAECKTGTAKAEHMRKHVRGGRAIETDAGFEWLTASKLGLGDGDDGGPAFTREQNLEMRKAEAAVVAEFEAATSRKRQGEKTKAQIRRDAQRAMRVIRAYSKELRCDSEQQALEWLIADLRHASDHYKRIGWEDALDWGYEHYQAEKGDE